MATPLLSSLSLSLQNPSKTLKFPIQKSPLFGYPLAFREVIKLKPAFPLSFCSSISSSLRKRLGSVSSTNVSSIPSKTRNYEFCDADTEVELRLDIGALDIQSSNDVFVDADETSLLIRVKSSGRLITLMESRVLFDRIKSSETIWYLDEDQLVVNLKKYDRALKWPDIMESWESLKSGVLQLLKGTSVFIVGDSTEMNKEVARELAIGLGYMPISTNELLESYAQQTIDAWVISEGADSVAEAESTVFESLSSHVRTVVATLGGKHGAATRHDKWRHLYAGFSVWLSKSTATDEASAKEEARRNMQGGDVAYSNADVVVKFGEWAPEHTTVVAQACLSALKQLILSDKGLTGKKSLYIRLGCRGDWPNIKPPGWDPSSGAEPSA